MPRSPQPPTKPEWTVIKLPCAGCGQTTWHAIAITVQSHADHAECIRCNTTHKLTAPTTAHRPQEAQP